HTEYNRLENTITIARAGKCGWVSYIPVKFYLNDKCFSLDLKIFINPFFLFNSLKNIQDNIMDLGSNSTIPTITSSSLKTVMVHTPQLPEQNKIAQTFSSLDSLLTLHQRKCEKLKKIKQELLNKMFV
ncbi:restriction endonuclease subunit S, partial [Mycoplasmopsis opalescens]|uniref:restriction endonuclease subunit S n=1 Tax=Mycoplasmopsis opalescens TaxID=114886 RepID=UPI0018E67E49